MLLSLMKGKHGLYKAFTTLKITEINFLKKKNHDRQPLVSWDSSKKIFKH
jgi:hypothetical protein